MLSQIENVTEATTLIEKSGGKVDGLVIDVGNPVDR